MKTTDNGNLTTLRVSSKEPNIEIELRINCPATDCAEVVANIHYGIHQAIDSWRIANSRRKAMMQKVSLGSPRMRPDNERPRNGSIDFLS